MTFESDSEQLTEGAEFDPRHPAEVLIVDVGAQYRMRFFWELAELGIRADMVAYTFDPQNPEVPPTLDVEEIKRTRKAVFFTGGGGSVDDGKTPPLPSELVDGSIPVFGNCLGAQLITEARGGKVAKFDESGNALAEYGRRLVNIVAKSQIFGDTHQTQVHMSHGYGILEVPPGFLVTSRSGEQVASFESNDGRIIATLFHPEVRDTTEGIAMMKKFLANAGVEPQPDYDAEKALEEYIENQESLIREKLLAGARIEGFLSGGIDSIVACKSVVKVANELGRIDQVRFTYVDNGHMRIEDQRVIESAISAGIPIRQIEASDRFFNERVELEREFPDGTVEVFLARPLCEEADPEVRRAIHGTIFALIAQEIIDEVREQYGRDVFFVQGSNESDAVSSGRGSSKKIKSHHNIKFMEPLRRAGLLIEPLFGLYKHHIRQLAEERYGIEPETASRQPFPGPGLSPRIVVNPSGELLPTDPEEQRYLDAMVLKLSQGELQAHLVRSPAKFVGNKGDARCDGDAIYISGIADWGVIDRTSAAITDAFADVTRVFYTTDPIIRADISAVSTGDNPQFNAELQYAEEIKRALALQHDIDPYLSQHFVATVDVDLNGSGLPTQVLRLFITGDETDQIRIRRTAKSYETFVEGKAAMPGINVPEGSFWALIMDLKQRLKYHGSLVYDCTHKPPGSTELV